MSQTLPQLPPPPFGFKVPNQPSPARSVLEAIAEDKCYQKVENVDVHKCTCLRCGHEWHTLQPTKPKCCPTRKCHSIYWDRPRTNRPRKKVEKVTDEATKGIKMPGVKKNASRRVQESWPAQDGVANQNQIPSVPLGILEAMGEHVYEGAKLGYGEDSSLAGQLQGDASLGSGSTVSAGISDSADTGIPLGQSYDDSRSKDATDTRGENEEEGEEENLDGADEILKGILA